MSVLVPSKTVRGTRASLEKPGNFVPQFGGDIEMPKIVEPNWSAKIRELRRG